MPRCDVEANPFHTLSQNNYNPEMHDCLKHLHNRQQRPEALARFDLSVRPVGTIRLKA